MFQLAPMIIAMNGLLVNHFIKRGWREARLKDCFSYGKGLNITKTDLVEDGKPVISYGQIHAKQNDGTHLKGELLRYVPDEVARENPGARLKVGDIVFADTSEDLAGVGNCVLNDVGDGVYAGYHTLIARAKDPRNSKYLSYLFQTDCWREQLRKRACGIKVFSLTQRLLSNVKVVLPPRPEQERIAAFLDEKCATVDKAIEVKRKQLESVEPQWANLLHNVTLRGIRPSRLQKTTNVIIEKIPIGWKLKRLRYIGRCQNGISKDGQYFGYGFPFVTYGDVYNNMTLPVVASGLVESTEEERIRYSVKRGDVFFTRTSETADEVGFSSVCLKTIPDATFAGFVIRVRPVTEDLLPEFAQYYFRNPFVSQYFAKEMMVVTRASLSQDILKSLPVLIPPRDEQAQIAQYLGERRSYFDSLSANLRKQIETLEQYRKSLIHEYVTGVRRVV